MRRWKGWIQSSVLPVGSLGTRRELGLLRRTIPLRVGKEPVRGRPSAGVGSSQRSGGRFELLGEVRGSASLILTLSCLEMVYQVSHNFWTSLRASSPHPRRHFGTFSNLTPYRSCELRHFVTSYSSNEIFSHYIVSRRQLACTWISDYIAPGADRSQF